MDTTYKELQQLKAEGEALVEQRAKEYGPPHEHFEKVAKSWSLICGQQIDPEQVCLMMAALKAQREDFKHNPDNIRDHFGYMKLAEMVRKP